jgi:hypothetical protein
MAALDDEGIELPRRNLVDRNRFSSEEPKKTSDVQAVLPDRGFLNAAVPPQELQIVIEDVRMRTLDGRNGVLQTRHDADAPNLCEENGERPPPALHSTDRIDLDATPGPWSLCNFIQKRLNLDLVDIAQPETTICKKPSKILARVDIATHGPAPIAAFHKLLNDAVQIRANHRRLPMVLGD